MRRVAAVLAALSIGTTSCSFSSVDPDAEVTISGRALDADGAPLTDASVLLFKQADIGEVLFGSILAVGSLATICFLPDPPSICEKGQRVTTDADGRYSFELTGEDTQGTLGTASTMSVVFSGKPGSAALTFTAEEAEITLPDTQLWAAQPRRRGSTGLSWRKLPASSGSKPTYSVQLYAARTGAPLWSEPASGTRGTVDPRILESAKGFIAAGASARPSGASGAGDLRLNFLSTKVAVSSSAGAPPSRGRRCAALTGTGPVRSAKFGPCGVTDGELAQPSRLAVNGSGPVTGVVVDLGSSRRVTLAVARGFAGQLLLETSSDGASYTVVATGSGTTVGLTPNAPVTARYVRLRSPSGVDQSFGAELSIW